MKILSGKVSRRRMMSLALAAGAAMGAMSGKAKGDIYTWQGSALESDWFSTDAWLDANTGEYGTPGGGAVVTVGQGVAGFAGNYSSSPLNLITVDWNMGADRNVPQISQSGGTMSSNYEEVGYSSTGDYYQAGGTNDVAVSLYLGFNAGSSGTYELGNLGLFTTPTLNAGNEFIGDSGGGYFTQAPGSTNNVSDQFVLGQSAGSSGTYVMTEGSLNVGGFETIGGGGVGNFTQGPGATNTAGEMVIGNSAGGSGIYTMTGGLLNAYYVFVGESGSGTFNQSGGTLTINVAGNLILGYPDSGTGGVGTYNLSGTGTVVAQSRVLVGDLLGGPGTGVLNISGGSMTVDDVLQIASAAGNQVNLSGGTLSANTIDTFGNPADFLGNETTTGWTGGTLTLTGQPLDISDGTDPTYSANPFGNSLTLHNGQTLNVSNPTDWEYLYGNGSSITQNGGSNNTPTLEMGNYTGVNAATYTLNGGSLSVGGAEYIGYIGEYYSGSNADAVFTQTGGTNTATAVYVGYSQAYTGKGTYNLSGTGSLQASEEDIGYARPGIFNQSGGTNTIGGNLNLGTVSPGSGTYNLGGTGLANISGAVYVGGGPSTIGANSTLNISGGTMNVAGALTIYDGSQVNFSGGTLAVASINNSGDPGGFIGNGTTTGWTGGTLTLGSSLIIGTANTDPLGAHLTITSAQNLNVGGDLTVAGQSIQDADYDQEGGHVSVGGNMNVIGDAAGVAHGATLEVFGSETLAASPVWVSTFYDEGGYQTIHGDLNVGTTVYQSGESGGLDVGVDNTFGGTTVDGNVYVGGSAAGPGGEGEILVESGSMTVGGMMEIYPNTGSTVSLSGGSLTVGSLAAPTGFGWSKGTLTLTNQDAGIGFVNSSTLELGSGPSVAFQSYQTLSLPNNSFTIASGSALALKGSMSVGGNFTIGQTAGFGFFGSGATLQVGGNFVNNGGNFAVTGNNVFLESPTTIGGTLVNNATGVLQITNTNVTVGSGTGTQALSNLGTIQMHNSTINLLGPADLPGTIVPDPSIMNFEGGLTIDSTGSIQAGAGDIIAVSGGDLVDNSTVAPSFGSATLHMDGTGTQKIVLGTSEAAGMTVGTLDVGSSTLNIVDGSGNPATLVTDDLVFDGTTAPTINGTIVDQGAASLTGAQAISVDTPNASGTDLFWTSTSGGFSFSNGATYTNSGVFNAANDQSFSGTGTFDNEGTFRKQMSVGTTVVSIPFINNGLVDAHSGTLSFQGGVSGTGNYSIASGATMEVRNSNLSGGDLDNEGTLLITNTPGNGIPGIATVGNVTGAGTTTIVGAQSTLSAASGSQTSLIITDGQIALRSGDFVATNVTLNNATLIGNAGTSTGSPTGPAVDATGTLSTGNLTMMAGAILNIAGSANVTANNIAGDANTEVNVQSGGSLTNAGTNGLYFGIPVNVDGTISATGNGGFIFFEAGGTHSGTFNISANSAITGDGDFTASSVVNDNGNFTLGYQAATEFDGTLNVGAGATLTLQGTSAISSLATVNFADGANLSAPISGSATFNNNQVMNVGTANLSGNITFRNAGLSFNALTYGSGNGPSELAIETGGTVNIGTLNDNGNQLGSGLTDGHPTTLVVGTFNLASLADVSADIDVTTAMNWTGGGLDGGDGTDCTVTIEPGATLNISGTGGSLTRGAVLINDGNLVTAGAFTIGKSDGSGLGNTFNVALNSVAQINGILGVGNDGALTAGTGTGILNVSGLLTVSNSIILGSNVGGSGALNIFPGGLANAAGLNMNDATISGGELDIPSSTVQPGDDPEIDGSIVGGYLRNGAFNVNGGIVISPKIKLGVSSGFTGTYTQTGGSVTTGILGVGNDASISSGAGIGNASVSGGTLAATSILIGSTVGGTGNLTVSGTANVSAGSMINLGSFTMSGGTATIGGITGTGSTTITGGTVQISPHSGVSSQGALAVSGTGVLDITDNTVVVNYGVGNPSPVASIGAAIKSAYSGATFSGAGITSSTVAGVNGLLGNSHAYAIGYADASDPAVKADDFTPGTVVIEPALVGDANLDGKVNYTDFQIFSANFNGVGTSWDQGDFNYAGKTSYVDFQLLAGNFNDSTSLDNAEFDAMDAVALSRGEMLVANGDGDGFSFVAVPEPASVGILTVASFGLLGRRRRRARKCSTSKS